jgi:uncharacterized repeat protein (TIGR04076 family)
MEKYENPLENACDMTIGDVFISENGKRPQGFCENAWMCLLPYASVLAHGGKNFHDGWMKNEKSAMVSCDDGFRPVSFLIETIEE